MSPLERHKPSAPHACLDGEDDEGLLMPCGPWAYRAEQLGQFALMKPSVSGLRVLGHLDDSHGIARERNAPLLDGDLEHMPQNDKLTAHGGRLRRLEAIIPVRATEAPETPPRRSSATLCVSMNLIPALS